MHFYQLPVSFPWSSNVTFVAAVKLPELLYYAKIEKETSMELQQKLTDFLK